eukprot:13038129-Alexandrium_andersonii.AAC.1
MFGVVALSLPWRADEERTPKLPNSSFKSIAPFKDQNQILPAAAAVATSLESLARPRSTWRSCARRRTRKKRAAAKAVAGFVATAANDLKWAISARKREAEKAAKAAAAEVEKQAKQQDAEQAAAALATQQAAA